MVINGYNVLGPVIEEEVIYMWNKKDIIDHYTGKWITIRDYLERDKLFPYSPNDKPGKEFKNGELIDILHPPIYFDKNGNQLPGNGEGVSAKSKEINWDKFNYYNSGNFFTVSMLFFIACILITIFINDGYIMWFLFIPYFIYGYKQYIKYHNM